MVAGAKNRSIDHCRGAVAREPEALPRFSWSCRRGADSLSVRVISGTVKTGRIADAVIERGALPHEWNRIFLSRTGSALIANILTVAFAYCDDRPAGGGTR
jgi:hypothetical protein